MFAKFSIIAPDTDDSERATVRHISSAKSKRSQVPRACEWCRLNHIKCDSHARCRNCRHRNEECVRDSRHESLTMSSALKEIGRLRAQVAQLETQSEQPLSKSPGHLADEFSVPTPPNARPTSAASVLGEAITNRNIVHSSSTAAASRSFYGPSAVQNIVCRMQRYLRLAYGWSYSLEDLHPKSITLSLVASSESGVESSTTGYNGHGSPLDRGVFMGKDEEVACISIFWESYQCTIPVLDEVSFREHHSSLWQTPSRHGGYRDDSPLVDLVLAISVQYGMTHIQTPLSPLGGDNDEVLNGIDPSNAGRWYFQRSQILVKAELERPSIMLLQCQILSAIYLRDASLLNTALSTIATAVQTGYSLGLHLNYNPTLDRHKRELYKRLWCYVYALEGKLSMEADRPAMIPALSIDLPQDDHELASSSTTLFVPYSRLKISWVTFHVHHVRLIQAAREAYALVSPLFVSSLGRGEGLVTFLDPNTLQSHDGILKQAQDLLASWAVELPEELRYDKADVEVPVHHHTTTQSSAEIKTLPRWLRLQRVILQFMYHDTLVGLFRPFIIFPSLAANGSTTPSSWAIECLRHAFAIVDMTYDVICKSDLLHGWHRAYQFQWAAAITMIAFGFAYPASPWAATTVAKLEHALHVLNTFGRSFAVARSASGIIHELYLKLKEEVSVSA